MKLDGKPEVYAPLRMMAKRDRTEVELVLSRQAGMTDRRFDRDTELVRALKAVLEASKKPGRSQSPPLEHVAQKWLSVLGQRHA